MFWGQLLIPWLSSRHNLHVLSFDRPCHWSVLEALFREKHSVRAWWLGFPFSIHQSHWAEAVWVGLEEWCLRVSLYSLSPPGLVFGGLFLIGDWVRVLVDGVVMTSA